MRVGFLVIVFIIVGGLGWWGHGEWFRERNKAEKRTMVLGSKRIRVEVRDTFKGRNRGLSGRKSLAEDEGMLFVFPQVARHSFWMKGMLFDLDFIWIRDDRVVGFSEGVRTVPTGERIKIIRPEVAVDKVLEMKSGWVKNRGIEIGDKLKQES